MVGRIGGQSGDLLGSGVGRWWQVAARDSLERSSLTLGRNASYPWLKCEVWPEPGGPSSRTVIGS